MKEAGGNRWGKMRIFRRFALRFRAEIFEGESDMGKRVWQDACFDSKGVSKAVSALHKLSLCRDD